MNIAELLQIGWLLSLIKILVIIFLFAMPLASLLTYFERKWSALIQDRVGPSRANIGKLKFKGKFKNFPWLKNSPKKPIRNKSSEARISLVVRTYSWINPKITITPEQKKKTSIPTVDIGDLKMKIPNGSCYWNNRKNSED